MKAIIQPIERLPAPLLLLTAIVSIQLGAVLAIGLFPLFGPLGVLFLRMTIGGAVLCCLYRGHLLRGFRQAPRGILLLGLLMAVQSGIFYESLARIPLGIAVAIEFLGPLGVALAASRRWLDVLCVVLAAGGILLLTPDIGSRLDPVGVLYAFGAGMGWAVYILLSKRIGRAVEGGVGLALAMIFAALLLLPVSGLGALAQLTVNGAAIPAVLGVALFSAAIPLLLEFLALKSMPTKTFGILIAAEPMVATVIGFALLGDRIGWRGWLAILLITFASIAAAWLAREAHKMGGPE